MAKKAEKLIKSHKEGNDLNIKADVKELTGMNSSKTEPRLDAWDDVAETDPEDIGGSMATIEATLNYINKVLNEGDETGPEDELDSDDLNDAELDMADDDEDDDGDNADDENVDFEDNGDTGFGDDGEDEGDMEECGEEDEDFEGYGADEDEDDDDFDADVEDEDDDMDAGDEDEDEDLEDDFSEGFWLENDEMPDTEVIGTEPDSDLDDETDGEASAGISVDIPDDVDPNDVEVSIGGSSYVPDIDSAEDVEDEEVGDEDEDEGEFDEDDVVSDEEDEDDVPVSESSVYDYYHRGVYEEDDPEIDDVTDDDEDSDGEPESDEDEIDDEDDELNGIDDEADEVSEAVILKALRKLIREDQRSDDPHTEDPSCNTGDDPIDCECEVDDSTAEEDDLSGDEGEVADADIPIEKGTIQPEEAAELRFLAKKLRKIMEGDEDSHKDDGKTSAEPLDSDAEDMLDDIGDALESDETLTDTGNGAIDDGETTLGGTDEEEKITDNDDINYVSSNGNGVDDDDEDNELTDNYHGLMNLIDKAFSECGKKGKKPAKKKKVDLKKVKLKKSVKKAGKKVRAGVEGDFGLAGKKSDVVNVGGKFPTTLKKATDTAANGANDLEFKEGKTLENTVLGNFNKSEMTSVLKSLNNAFGTGSTSVAKEIRDSQVVSEVSVPTKALPIAENASWDGISAGKLLVETAYKSESKVNTNLLKLTHLYWLNEGTDPSDYKFPIASMVEGKAQIIPEAIDEATKLFASPSFILRFSESALKKIRNVLDFYNEKMGKKSPWKSNDQIQVSEAAKITMIDRTSYNPYAVLKRLSEQENAKKLINLRG